jgi:GAF domain-containing protein
MPNAFEQFILAPWLKLWCQALSVYDVHQQLRATLGPMMDFDPQSAQCRTVPLSFEKYPVGRLDVILKSKIATAEFEKAATALGLHIAPLFFGPPKDVQHIERNLNLLGWLNLARQQQPEVCDWIGIYFKESFVFQKPSTDLILGPYLGEVTEHIRISFDRGICGLAIREERTVNVPDVRTHSSHIACSINTRSELVIPLTDSSGSIVAELDIDSNHVAAFTPEIEKQFRAFARTFAQEIKI